MSDLQFQTPSLNKGGDVKIREDINVQTISNGKNAVQKSTIGYEPNINKFLDAVERSVEVQVVQRELTADNIQLEIFRNRSEMEAQIILRDTGEIIDRIPVAWKARENKLDYLSVSKIQAYEQCPSCFYKQYMAEESKSVDGSNYFTKFGSILHEVVEVVVRAYVENGIILNHMAIFEDVWKKYDLTGFDAYVECKGLIADHFDRTPVDKHNDIPVLIEKEWRGQLGGCEFGMMIDYAGVYINNPKKGRLLDYKSNRMPFTQHDLEHSLQLRIYEIILRRHLMPDVEEWVSGYELFRYGWQQCPSRTPEDLEDAEQYVANVWHQITHDNTWEENLNNYCGYRECRHTCKKYQDFVTNPARYVDSIKTDSSDIALVEKQRELMITYEKIAKTRKDELANAVKAEIEHKVMKGEKLIIDGKELSLFAQGKESYNYYDTRNVLLSHNKLDILDKCLSIQKTKLDGEVSKHPTLKLALAGCMNMNYSSPYIVKKKAK